MERGSGPRGTKGAKTVPGMAPLQALGEVFPLGAVQGFFVPMCRGQGMPGFGPRFQSPARDWRGVMPNWRR